MSSLRRLALALCAAPLALGLAACGDTDVGGLPSSEPIAKIAAPAGQQWVDAVALTPEGGWLVGNPQAPIKLVEYGSLTCPACANFSQTGMQPLRDEYVSSGRVSWELRSVPLHGAVDLVLTRLLKCAPKEAGPLLAEQLWGNLNAVLDPIQANAAAIEQAMSLPEDQRFVAYAEQGQLLEFFAQRGIAADQARQCLSDFAAMQALAQSLQAQSDKDGVTGTPTFFINGSRMDETNWASVEAALQRAGAR
ncbi:MAG TPA: thioredoxin domain-containing protein [Croceibacterium sp.]